ncbi:MAG: ATP-binding protein [Candidatus Competibacteraceae bacterium]|jgi:signal transduction histidine kinase|nr:ATP-binding protein [Candidatus Competibacteraceae bacterium]
MLKTLYAKLALILFAVLLAIGLLHVLISQSATQRNLAKASQHFNRHLARNLVAERNLVSQGQLDQAALKETFEMYMTINPSIEIYLLARDGRILAYSAEPGKVKLTHVSLLPIQKFLRNDAQLPVLGDDPRGSAQGKIFSVTPVPSAESLEGYLYVVLLGEEYDALARLYQDSLLLRSSAWILAGSLLFGLLVGLLLFAQLTRRLRRLNRLMADFRARDFRSYHPYQAQPGGDEIEQLGDSFDQLAERMQALLTRLEAKDALRRKLVSNVSHDLRTPLACLHGYLQTLQLKRDELSAQQQTQYLNTALHHSERLGHLVGELFELAKLEAREIKPQKEPFPPAELIQDIAQKFQVPVQQKHIQLLVRFPEDAPFISADIGLLERVLENLLQNALNHTPENGRILLALSYRDNMVTLTVADTGCGIAPDALPFIFERFYRSAQDGSHHHAGLGLAIASHIVALHNSQLRVASQLNKGTCFAFNLPVWQAH